MSDKTDKDKIDLTEFERGMIARYGTKKYTQSELDREVTKAVESKKAEWQREAREEVVVDLQEVFELGIEKGIEAMVNGRSGDVAHKKYEKIKAKYLTKPSKEEDNE